MVLHRSPGNNQVNIALMALQTGSSQQKALQQFSDTVSLQLKLPCISNFLYVPICFLHLFITFVFEGRWQLGSFVDLKYLLCIFPNVENTTTNRLRFSTCYMKFYEVCKANQIAVKFILMILVLITSFIRYLKIM